MPDNLETEETFRTPSLDEFLIDEAQRAMGEIQKYVNPTNDGQKRLKEKFSEKNGLKYLRELGVNEWI